RSGSATIAARTSTLHVQFVRRFTQLYRRKRHDRHPAPAVVSDFARSARTVGRADRARRTHPHRRPPPAARRPHALDPPLCADARRVALYGGGGLRPPGGAGLSRITPRLGLLRARATA